MKLKNRIDFRGMVRSLSGQGANVGLASMASVGLKLAATGIRMVIQIALANWLGAAGFGLFSVVRGWAGLLSNLPNRGYNLAFIRWLPAYREQGDGRSYRLLITQAVRTTLIGSIVLAFVVVAVARLIEGEFTAAGAATAILLITTALANLSRQVLKASYRHVLGVWLAEFVHPIAFGVAALVSALVLGRSVGAVLGSLAAATLLVAVLQAYHVARDLPEASGPAEPDPRWREGIGPLFVGQLGVAAQETMYLLIVGFTLGATAAGLFAVAQRLAVLARIGNNAVATIVSPELGRLREQENATEAMQSVVDKGVNLSLAFTGAAIALLAAGSGFAVRLFGSDFEEAQAILLVLLIGNVANAATGPIGYLISMVGSESTYGFVMAVHAVAGALAALAGGLFFESVLVVAAVATITTISWNTTLVVIGGRTLGVWSIPRPLRRLVAA